MAGGDACYLPRDLSPAARSLPACPTAARRQCRRSLRGDVCRQGQGGRGSGGALVRAASAGFAGSWPDRGRSGRVPPIPSSGRSTPANSSSNGRTCMGSEQRRRRRTASGPATRRVWRDAVRSCLRHGIHALTGLGHGAPVDDTDPPGAVLPACPACPRRRRSLRTSA